MKPESIQEAAWSFMECRVFLTGVELGLFSMLTGDGMAAQQVASRIHGDLRGTTVLLDALAALGFLVKKGGVYGTEPGLRPFLSEDSEDSVLPSLRHAAHLWHAWSALTEIVLRGPSARPPLHGRQERREDFIGAMQVRARRDAARLVKAIHPGDALSLIDIGGAAGGYTEAFLAAFPRMTATLFDLPPVIEMARKHLSASGLLNRVRLVAGDFNTDELPGGHDLALLSAIIHMNSPEQNGVLYGKVYRSLVPGGRLVIRDHVMDPDRTRPASGALFAVNMLVNTDGGGTYTFEEIREGLERAGFRKASLLRNAEGFSLVEAYRTLPGV